MPELGFLTFFFCQFETDRGAGQAWIRPCIPSVTPFRGRKHRKVRSRTEGHSTFPLLDQSLRLEWFDLTLLQDRDGRERAPSAHARPILLRDPPADWGPHRRPSRSPPGPTRSTCATIRPPARSSSVCRTRTRIPARRLSSIWSDSPGRAFFLSLAGVWRKRPRRLGRSLQDFVNGLADVAKLLCSVPSLPDIFCVHFEAGCRSRLPGAAGTGLPQHQLPTPFSG